MAITAVADVVVPVVYAQYQQTFTEQKSELVQSGAMTRDPEIDAKLAGGGLTFNLPRWRDLADDAANVSIGATGSAATPKNITTHSEKGVRLSRNQGWGAVDLAEALAGDDPMMRIAARVAPYWTRRLQDAVLATLKGVFADNTANDSGDYTKDISGAFGPSTEFSGSAFLDAVFTMGDSEKDLGIVIMHSAVYAKALKNDFIDFIPDAVNQNAQEIPFYLGRRVLVDDRMPKSGGTYETFILGAGALRWGFGTPKTPLESIRVPRDANGGGSEELWSRVEWCIHPTGHAFVAGTIADGGPDDTANANMLGAAASWNRVAAERKQVKIARLITTEHA